MKLDRDINPDGCGKYALINLRRLNAVGGNAGPYRCWPPEVAKAIQTLEEAGVIEWGRTGSPDEFFVIKLKDENATEALTGYAVKVCRKDREYGGAVFDLAKRSGRNSPFCKSPD